MGDNFTNKQSGCSNPDDPNIDIFGYMPDLVDAITYFEYVYESMVRPPGTKNISVKENTSREIKQRILWHFYYLDHFVSGVEANWVPTNESRRLPCGLFHANVPLKASKQPAVYPNGKFVFILIILLSCAQNIFSRFNFQL